MCVVCGIASSTERCKACHEVFVFVSQLTEPQRLDYILVVDGSFSLPNKAGAGLVLAREYDESVVACCAVPFSAFNSDDAEFQAIRKGILWAPLGLVWSDNAAAIKSANSYGLHSTYIRPHMRDPVHNLAHRLANIARLDAWDRLDKLWIPGEVWP